MAIVHIERLLRAEKFLQISDHHHFLYPLILKFAHENRVQIRSNIYNHIQLKSLLQYSVYSSENSASLLSS